MCLHACAWESIYLCTCVPVSVCACRHMCMSLHDCGCALSVCMCMYMYMCLSWYACISTLEWYVYAYECVTINTDTCTFCVCGHAWVNVCVCVCVYASVWDWDRGLQAFWGALMPQQFLRFWHGQGAFAGSLRDWGNYCKVISIPAKHPKRLARVEDSRANQVSNLTDIVASPCFVLIIRSISHHLLPTQPHCHRSHFPGLCITTWALPHWNGRLLEHIS